MHNYSLNAIALNAITCHALDVAVCIPAIRISSHNVRAGKA
jgi:hypothetical protein